MNRAWKRLVELNDYYCITSWIIVIALWVAVACLIGLPIVYLLQQGKP